MSMLAFNSHRISGMVIVCFGYFVPVLGSVVALLILLTAGIFFFGLFGGQVVHLISFVLCRAS